MPPATAKPSCKDKYLCVDFLNTEHMSKNGMIESLTTAQQGVEWLIGLGVFPEPDDQEMLQDWVRDMPVQVLAQLHALRDDLRQLVTALQAGQPLPSVELARLQALLHSGSRTAQLVNDAGHWHLQSRLDLRRPQHLVVPLAESFAELLVSGEAARVKKCASPRCTVLFYDATKNQRRAWCEACGTQVKALRYYHKQNAKA